MPRVLNGPLTARQLEALRWIARGYTSEAAARHMGCEAGTVRDRLHIAYRRLGARSAAHAVAIALIHGLLTADDIQPRTANTPKETAA